MEKIYIDKVNRYYLVMAISIPLVLLLILTKEDIGISVYVIVFLLTVLISFGKPLLFNNYVKYNKYSIRLKFKGNKPQSIKLENIDKIQFLKTTLVIVLNDGNIFTFNIKNIEILSLNTLKEMLEKTLPEKVENSIAVI